jgi:hypothetical protein
MATITWLTTSTETAAGKFGRRRQLKPRYAHGFVDVQGFVDVARLSNREGGANSLFSCTNSPAHGQIIPCSAAAGNWATTD